MTTVTQPLGLKPPHTADQEAVRAGLELLANGGCDQSAFLQSMQQRFDYEPDGNWEVLAQLDQFYRRGKINPEMFQAIKAELAGPPFGSGNDPISGVTAPAQETPPPGLPGPHAAAWPHAAAAVLKVGDKLRDRYRIERLLGQGGMGTVFEAIDDYRLEAPPSGRRLAIKVLHTAVTTQAELFAELRREFQHLQLLSHRNIVRVFEFDRDGPLAFFTMELLSGALLSRVLLARRVTLEHAHSLAVIRDVGAAIAHAHSRGVVHGDINPQNIFITSGGELRVLDFGASHRMIVDPKSPEDEITPARFATPGYASCQVLEAQRPDARDDVFALACVAYRLLCGEHPFSERSAVEARAAGSIPRKPAKLSHHQWRVLREGLHWDREMRPGDVQTWLERMNLRGAAKSLPALTDLLEPPAAANSAVAFLKVKALPAALGLAVAVALAGGYWWVTTSSRSTPIAGSPVRAVPPAPAPAPQMPVPRADLRLPPPIAAPGESAMTAQPVAPAGESTATAQPVAPPRSSFPPAIPWVRPALLEMAADTVEVPAGETTARVLVRRQGNLHGATGFTWWTESGTAKPGTDFVPVVPQIQHIGDEETSVSLSIPLTGASHAQSRSFYVVIDSPEGNGKLGTRALTMVTLGAAASQ